MLIDNSLQGPKSRLSSVIQALGVQPGEGLATALLFAQSFGLGVMMFAMFTAANALFLAEFGAEALPYIYIVAAVVIIAVGVGFTKLEQRIPFSQLLLGTIFFMGLSILLLRLALGLFQTPWLLFILPVWFRLLWVLGNLVLWALAGRLFDLRQGKRLFSLILAGAVFAIIISSLVISPAIDRLGPLNLLYIASTCLAVVLGLLWVTIHHFGDRLNRDTPVSSATTNRRQSQWPIFLRSHFIWLIFIYTAFSALGTYVLDFAFFAETRARFADVNTLGTFLGGYIGVATLVTLVASVAAGPILSRFGLKLGLWANPGAVAIGTILVVGALMLFGSTGPIFWLIVMTKMFDEVLVVATTNTSVRLLYQPLPRNQQVPLQTAVEGVVTPLSMGLAGVILLILRALSAFSTMQIIYLLLIILFGWIGASLFLSRAYQGVLIKALLKRHFVADTKPLLSDKSSLTVVNDALGSNQADVVIYALNLLEANDAQSLPPFLPDLLAHSQPEVRLEVLGKIEKYRFSTLLPSVEQILRSEPGSAVQGAAFRTFSALSGAKLLQDIDINCLPTDPVIQQQVLVGLLRYGGLEGMLPAVQTLLRLVDSANAADRIMVANVLGDVNIRGYYHPLERLLSDDDIDVRQAALQAAGQLRHPDLWPKVAQALSTPETRQVAAEALSTGSDTALSSLVPLFAASEQDIGLLAVIAQIAGRIQGQEAIAFLLPHIAFPHPLVRTHILRALIQCDYQAESEAMAHIQTQIKSEVDQAAWFLANMHDLGQDTVMSPLQEALQVTFAQTRERIFALLAFTHDPQAILRAQVHLTHSSEKTAYALEILDVLLTREIKQIVFPLMDNSLTTDQRLERLSVAFPQTSLTQTERLQILVQAPETQASRWVKACAIYVIGVLKDHNLTETIQAMLTSLDPLLQETAAQALRRIAPGVVQPVVATSVETAVAQTSQALAEMTITSPGEIPMLSTIERTLFLKSADIFNQLSGEALVWVAQAAQEVQFLAGERFIQQGDPDTCLYIIVSGQVDVVRDGGKKMAVLSEKSAIGEMALFSERPRTANGIAVTDITALKIEQADFQALLAEKSELAMGIIQVLIQRLEKTS